MKNTDLSPRTIKIAITPDSNHDATVVPLDYLHPIIAAECADALLAARESFGLADGTLYHYRRAVESFLRALPDSLSRSTSFSSPDSDLLSATLDWELSLGRTYSGDSSVPNKVSNRLRRIVKIHAVANPSGNKELLRWASSPSPFSTTNSRPLNEFSNAERIAIRNTCRSIIRMFEQRHLTAQKLLVHGADPRKAGWHSLPNLLWATRYMGREPGTSFFRDLAKGSQDGTLAELGLKKIDPFVRETVQFLSSCLYPTDRVLVAFRTLLQLENGAAPEEWSGVTLNDIVHDENTMSIRLHKARAHRSRTISCTVSSDDRSSGWRAGDLVHRLLSATKLARDEAIATNSEFAQSLFLTVLPSTSALKLRHAPFERNPFSSMLRTITPGISEPHDSRRLRKTVKSARASVLKSINIAADNDHSVAVFQRHYAQSTTVHVLAGASINSAQSQVFDKLQQGPKLIKSKAKDSVGVENPQIAEAAAATASLPDNALEVTQCTSPYSSPYTPVGRLCEHRPLMCFACPNAIVFKDHLPRILSYQAVLESYEQEMTPQTFAAMYGQQIANITRILEEFSADDLRKAHQKLHESDLEVHVPLSQRGTHL